MHGVCGRSTVTSAPGSTRPSLSPRPSFLCSVPFRYARMDSQASTAHSPSFSLQEYQSLIVSDREEYSVLPKGHVHLTSLLIQLPTACTVTSWYVLINMHLAERCCKSSLMQTCHMHAAAEAGAGCCRWCAHAAGLPKQAPDVVGARAEALLAAQRAAPVVHQVAEELPVGQAV